MIVSYHVIFLQVKVNDQEEQKSLKNASTSFPLRFFIRTCRSKLIEVCRAINSSYCGASMKSDPNISISKPSHRIRFLPFCTLLCCVVSFFLLSEWLSVQIHVPRSSQARFLGLEGHNAYEKSASQLENLIYLQGGIPRSSLRKLFVIGRLIKCTILRLR